MVLLGPENTVSLWVSLASDFYNFSFSSSEMVPQPWVGGNIAVPLTVMFFCANCRPLHKETSEVWPESYGNVQVRR